MVNNASSWYAYPNATDSDSFLNLFGYINRSVEGLFFPVILLVIWFIAFVGVFSSQGSNRVGAGRAFTFASFLCSILAIPLVITGFLAVKFMYLCFIFVAVGALWIKLQAPAGD